ncbi:MAG: type I methionyl aminopeptidase [Candidatus Peribacteraceae bacterium]|nr:type I methionyl aminopeptidase [Candidatus Peribacteraceae bacterium]
MFTTEEIESLRKGGKILRDCLIATGAIVKPGMTTKQLDVFAEEFIRSHEGATPAFKGYHGFPATLCTSVNDECVHGIPGPRTLKEGDIVSIDCGVILSKLYTDACLTVPVGAVSDVIATFLSYSEEALENACAIVAPGVKIGDISSCVQTYVERGGYSCVNGLTGHGLGTTLHQFPDVPNTGKAGTGPKLPVNTIIAIEPITSMGRPEIRESDDGWTIATKDRSLSAHFEHTVLVTERGVEILA